MYLNVPQSCRWPHPILAKDKGEGGGDQRHNLAAVTLLLTPYDE